MARKHTTRLTCILLILVVVGLACSDDDPSAQNAPMKQRHVSGSGCDNEEVVARGEGRSEGALSGDVDGDGDDDDIYIATDPDGVAGCRSFLVVDAGRTVYTTAVDPSGAPRSLSIPTLNSLADLDGESGTEIIVNVEMGASTQFVGAFGSAEGRLVRFEMNDKGPGPFAGEQGDLFAYGGSVGHLEAVDCAEEGHVVVSVALPKGSSANAYEVERRFFSVEDAELFLDKSLTEKHTVQGLKIDDFPEFASSPFGSCD